MDVVVFFVAGPGVEGVVGFAPPTWAGANPGGWGEEDNNVVDDKPRHSRKS